MSRFTDLYERTKVGASASSKEPVASTGSSGSKSRFAMLADKVNQDHADNPSKYTRTSYVEKNPYEPEQTLADKYRGLSYDQVSTYLNDSSVPSSDKEFLKHYGSKVGYSTADDYQKAIDEISTKMAGNSAATQAQKSGAMRFLENWMRAETGLRTGGGAVTDFGESPEYTEMRKEMEYLQAQKRKLEIDHAYDQYSSFEKNPDYHIYSRAVSPANPVSRYFAGMKAEDLESETTGPLAYAQDNEKATYQYILFAQGVDAANEYLEQMTPLWDKRKQEAVNQRVIDSMVTDNTAPGTSTKAPYRDAKSGQMILNNAASIPIGMVGGVIGGVASAFENLSGNPNPYSAWHSLSNYAETVRDTTSQYLEDNTTAEVAGYNVASALYNAGYSAVQSVVGANTFGKAYTYLMGLSAFEDESKRLYEDGASSAQILTGALLSGVAESLFEEFSIENLLTNSNPSSRVRVVKNILKQMGAEGSEEMATELSNAVSDYLVRGGASDYETRKRELMSNGISEPEATSTALKEIAKNIGFAGVEGALSGFAMSGIQQGIGYAQNKATGKDITKYGSADKVIDAARAASVESEEMAKADKGKKLTDAEIGALVGDTYRGVVDGMKTFADRDASEEDLEAQKAALEKYADIYGKEYQIAKKYNLSNEEKVKIDGVEVKDGEVLIRSEGELKKASEVPLTYRQAEIVHQAENMDNTAVREAFVSIANSNSVPVDTLRDAVGVIYFGARTQTMTWDEVQKQMVTDNAYMTEEQAKAVFDAGANLKAEAISVRQAKVDAIFKAFKGSATPGTFEDYTDHDTLNQYQSMMVTLGEGLSKLGINVVMEQRGYGVNGKYNKTTNTIHIDVLASAGKDLLHNTVLPVVSHELTHWMKDKSPAMYNDMSKYVLEYLTSSTGLTTEQLIDMELKRYAAAHEGKTESIDDAIDELTARSCEDMLGNTKKLTEFLEKKDRTFIEKFRAAIKKAFDRIISLFKDVDGAMSYSAEAREFQKNIEKFEELQKKWDAVFEDALKKNAAGVNKVSVDNFDSNIEEKMAEIHDVSIQNAERYGLTPDADGNLIFSDEAFYNSDHVADLRKMFSSDSGMTFAELLEEYKGAIQIWNELGGELNSKFLDEWNKQNPTKKAFTIFKAQTGYKYNIELSTMCKKGIPLFEAIDAIVRKEAINRLSSKTLGLDEKKVLYEVLQHHGFEIPCAICYVEQARQREGKIINNFLNGFTEKKKVKLGWNAVLDDIAKEMAAMGVSYEIGSLSRSVATDNYEFKPVEMDKETQDAFYSALIKLCNKEIDRWNSNDRKSDQKKKTHLKQPTLSAFSEAVGKQPTENLKIFKTLIADPDAIFKIDGDLLYSSFTTLNLSKCHPELASLFKAQSGVNGYKNKERAVAYTGDILSKKWSPSKVRNEGGVRNQSNSDGMMYTMLDQIQLYVDMSAKGYYLQAYTKVIAELKLLGLSNGKINASLIPAVHLFRNADGSVNEEMTRKYAGLDSDMKTPIFDNIEGISSEEAFMIIGMPEYSKSVCGICIGYSDEHIRVLLDDARVQMIIGFHDKTDDPNKRYVKARYAHNYNGENEAVIKKTGETKHVGFSTFLSAAEKKFKRSKSGDYSGSYTHTDGKTYSANDIPVLATVLYKEFCDSKGYDYAYKKFSDHPNYYKLLADFGLRDSEGNYAPHKKVTFKLPDKVPYLDADGSVKYEDTKEYMKRELEKELRVRDDIAFQLADTSETGIMAEVEKGINEFGSDVNKLRQYWAAQSPVSVEDESDADEMYALRGYNADGIEVYETSNKTMKLTWDERMEQFEDMIANEYAGRTARFVRNGHTYYATLDKAFPHKTIYGERHFDKKGWAAYIKAGADGDVFDLIENSKYNGSKPDTKNHAKKDNFTDYFDYFVKTIQIDNKVFDLSVTVKKKYKTDKGYTYTLYLTENKTKKASPAVASKSGSLNLAGNAFNKRVPQNPNAVNGADEMFSDRVLMGTMFSGAGTVEAGLVYQMVKKEFAVENNRKIASVYMDNHGKEHMFVGDVRDFNSKDKESVFYLHASPVCKNFSNASHTQGETKLDILTARATARVLKEQMPEVFTVENVKRYINSEAYNIIVSQLEDLGYVWDVDVYKAADYGNPTKRERMVIRAVKSGTLPEQPSKVARVSWAEATQDLWETELKPSYLVQSKLVGISNTPALANLDLKHLDRPLLIYDTTKSKQVTYAWGDELAPTLTTKCGDARIILTDGKVYRPTPKFMGRLQGLPDTFKYPSAESTAFKVIGNGIPTQLTKAVMGGVLDSAYAQTHNGDELYSDRDIVTPEDLVEQAIHEGELYGTEADEYMRYAKVRDMKLEDMKRLADRIISLNAEKTSKSVMLDRLTKKAAPTTDDKARISALKADIKRITSEIKGLKAERRETESQVEKLKTILIKLRADEKISAAEEKARRAKAKQEQAEMRTLQERYDRQGVSIARERDKRIRTIRTSVKTLADWINVNGKDNYVPEVLKEDVARFLQAFDYSTRDALGETFEYMDEIGIVAMPGIGREEDFKLSESLARLTDTVQRITDSNKILGGDKSKVEQAYEGIFLDLPKGFIETLEGMTNLMQNISNNFGEKKIVEHMSLDELAVLSETLNTLKKSIKGINELHQNAVFKKASDLGKSEIKFADSLGRLVSRNKTVQKALDLLGWKNLLPHFYFRRLGEAGESLGVEFRNAQAKFAFMAREIIDFTDKLFTGEEAKRWRTETETFTDLSGREFTMTIAQMMSIYCHGQRSASRDHMFSGGIRLEDITVNGKTISDTNKGHNISKAIYDEIVSRLAEYDDGKALAVAKELQHFMSSICAEWGNEVSMIRFGKKDFTEEFYIPIEVDTANDMNAEPTEGESLFRLLNMSFSKPLTPKAHNRIIIRDLFEVFAQHTSDMAKYNAFALPVLDAYKFINYREKVRLEKVDGYTPEELTSVRGSIEDAYGHAPIEYFFELMKDINGSTPNPRDASLLKQMMRNYKIARVGGNVKVAALQVTAYPRAAMVLSADSLMKAFKDGSNFDEAVKHSGLSAWKDLGYFDINVARGLSDQITHTQTKLDSMRELGTKGAEKSDSLTWGIIWNACKREALKRDERLRANSEAHLKKAGELMDEVIVSSQVMDSTFTRSSLMRNKDGMWAQLTAFMSEPTMTYNMVMDKYFDIITAFRQTGNWKEALIRKGKDGQSNRNALLKAASIHLVVSAFAALLEGTLAFWRDHKDEDKDGKLFDDYLKGLISAFGNNVLFQVPLVKELISSIQGYSSKNMVTQGISDTVDGARRIIKWSTDMLTSGKSKTSIIKAAYKALSGVSEMAGMVISNITREVLDVINFVLEITGNDKIDY